MNALEKSFRKNPIQKIEKKTVKVEVKLPHVNEKTLARKRISAFSLVIHASKKIHAAKSTRFFAPLQFPLP